MASRRSWVRIPSAPPFFTGPEMQPLFHCSPMRTVNQMRVVVESNAGIRVAELSLRDLRRSQYS